MDGRAITATGIMAGTAITGVIGTTVMIVTTGATGRGPVKRETYLAIWAGCDFLMSRAH